MQPGYDLACLQTLTARNTIHCLEWQEVYTRVTLQLFIGRFRVSLAKKKILPDMATQITRERRIQQILSL